MIEFIPPCATRTALCVRASHKAQVDVTVTSRAAQQAAQAALGRQGPVYPSGMPNVASVPNLLAYGGGKGAMSRAFSMDGAPADAELHDPAWWHPQQQHLRAVSCDLTSYSQTGHKHAAHHPAKNGYTNGFKPHWPGTPGVADEQIFQRSTGHHSLDYYLVTKMAKLEKV